MLAALARQQAAPPFEVVVVDDGSEPPAAVPPMVGDAPVYLLRTPGGGPARARNIGWRAGRGELVLFTDDDVDIDERWVSAAWDAATQEPDVLAFEGQVRTPAYDLLFAYSVAANHAGSGLTCNVAYRRQILERLGGFSEDFPVAHCEDLDLAFRVRDQGPVSYVDGMRVVHHPRAMTAMDFARRGTWARSELMLVRRHRSRYPRGVPARLLPLVYVLRHWGYTAYRERGDLVRRPRRGLRWVTAAVAQISVVTWIVATDRRALDAA